MPRNNHTIDSVIDREGFGHRVTLYRKLRGFTISELSERCGQETDQNVTVWGRGDKLPNLENLYKLCRALGVTADMLLKGEL